MTIKNEKMEITISIDELRNFRVESDKDLAIFLGTLEAGLNSGVLDITDRTNERNIWD